MLIFVLKGIYESMCLLCLTFLYKEPLYFSAFSSLLNSQIALLVGNALSN